MSKKYKGKLCVYCQERPSITQGDHVFSRELFLVSERDNPIKVPACDKCNNEKSRIEHYLTSLLPFGGMHSHAKEHLSTLVPSRLEKNLKIKRELSEGMEYIWSTDENGNPVRNLTVPFDGELYIALFEYIVRALSWYHWDSYITNKSLVYSTALTKNCEELFEKHFWSLNAKNKADNKIGDKTIIYKGSQGMDNDQITVWRFEIFNGLVVSDSKGNGFNKSSCIGSISGPPQLVNPLIELLEK